MSAPINHTCPSIDRVIESIKTSFKSATDAQSSMDIRYGIEQFTKEELYSMIEEGLQELSNIENELYNLESDMEDIRSDNSTLRDWGEQQEAEKEELEELQN